MGMCAVVVCVAGCDLSYVCCHMCMYYTYVDTCAVLLFLYVYVYLYFSCLFTCLFNFTPLWMGALHVQVGGLFVWGGRKVLVYVHCIVFLSTFPNKKY